MQFSSPGKYVFYNEKITYNNAIIDGGEVAFYVFADYDQAYLPVSSNPGDDYISFGLASPTELLLINSLIDNVPTRTLTNNFHLLNNINFADSNNDNTLDDPFDYDGALSTANARSIAGTYSGHFDGGNYNLIGFNSNYGGLFMNFAGTTTVTNLNVVDMTINQTANTAIGGLVNQSSATANIENVGFSNLVINGTTTLAPAQAAAAGLIGLISTTSGITTINNSFVEGQITYRNNAASSVGALIGSADNVGSTTITNSYATVDLTNFPTVANSFTIIGGLIGSNLNTNTVVSNS